MGEITRREMMAGTAAAALIALTPRAQAEEAASLPKTYAGTTLKVLWGSDPVFMQIARFSDAFSEATGIKLDFTTVNYGDRYQKMILDVTSKTNSFDVYLNAYQWKDELAPFAANLTNVEQEVKGAPPLDLDDYPQRALDVYGRWKGKLMALPVNGSATFFVWNKKAFRDSGLDPDAPAKSWAEVHQTGLKVKKGTQYGFNMPAGKSIQTACMWITLFHGFGGQYFAADGQPSFNIEAGIKTMRFMAEQLEAISPPGNLTWDFPEMMNSFVTGQAAQGFMWPGGFSTILDPAKSVVVHDLGWAPTPEVVMLGGWAVSVNAQTHSIEAAKLYVAWLTSKAVARRLALVTAQPCRISVFRDAEVIARYPHLPGVLEGMQGKVAAYVPIKESEQINIMIYDEANAACAGTKKPEQAAADLQDKVTAFMKRRGYLRG